MRKSKTVVSEDIQDGGLSIPSNVAFLDMGNSIGKGCTLGEKEETFVHALHRLTEAQYDSAIDVTGPEGSSPDYVRINGDPWAIGESAESYVNTSAVLGEARYTPDYYGVLGISMIARLYERSSNIAVFASHPSDDALYRDDLARSIYGKWTVEICGRTCNYNISYVNTADEPIWGMMNVLLTKDGTSYARTDINDGRALVIDVGGGTTDWQAFKDGAIDPSFRKSSEFGVREVVDRLADSLKASNPKLFKGSLMRPERVREAFETGEFRGGGIKIPCSREVDESSRIFRKKFADDFATKAGGRLAWDFIVLTGGGSALMHQVVSEITGHPCIILAETPSKMHMANVYGGRKMWKLLEAEGMLL